MKADVCWFLPWDSGAHGARSAVAGASGYLASMGMNSVVCGKIEIQDINARMYVLLGLQLYYSDLVHKLRPGAKIVMQNHSPWLFLECASKDWSKWLACLRWAREHEFHVAMVAQREYISAVAAFGATGICCVPAVYPFDCDLAPAPHLDLDEKLVVIAHKDRPWKNVVGQTVAACMASKEVPLKLRVYMAENTPRIVDIKATCKAFGVECEVREWKPQAEFRAELREADAGMCCTWAECYSQAALDYLTQGIPIVGSPANWFCPPKNMAKPDDVGDMTQVLVDILKEPDRETALRYANMAQAYQKGLLRDWVATWNK